MFLPVVDVNISDPTNQKFKFPLVKDVDKICGDKLIEASDERVELLFHALLNLPFGDKPEKKLEMLSQFVALAELTRRIPSYSHSSP